MPQPTLPFQSGDVIALQAENGLYFALISRANRNLIEAATTTIDIYSKFTVTVLGDKIALHAGNGLYLGLVDQGARNPIEAARSRRDELAQFTVVPVGNRIALTAGNGLYLSLIEDGGRIAVEANKRERDPFTQFNFSIIYRPPANPIRAENLLPGTDSWQLEKPPDVQAVSSAMQAGDLDRNTNRCPIIEGYAWPASVNIGENIKFYVSTISPTYSLEIFRMGYYGGKGGRSMVPRWTGLTVGGSTDPQTILSGGDASNWKAAMLNGSEGFQIPNNWVSGCFVAKIEESDGKQSYIFFIVRDDLRPSDLVMQCSITTYHAYNGWGGNSGYSYNTLDGVSRNKGQSIWLKRPYLPSSSPRGNKGAGAGAFFTHDKGPEGATTIPTTLANDVRSGGNLYSCSGWEYNMVRWLEMKGYDVTYCTNIDTHENQLSRASHKAFISVGHDEYWSNEAYVNVVNARDALGVSLLWFSGNTVFNRIDLSHEGRMSFHMDRSFGVWQVRDLSEEDKKRAMTDYKLVGGTWTLGVPPDKEEDFYLADTCPSWLKQEIPLQPDGSLGHKLIGYEGNGLFWDNGSGMSESERDHWRLILKSCLPAGIKDILTGKKTQAIWYTVPGGANVFSLSTIQWSWGLDDFTLEWQPNGRGNRQDAGVERFTENLIAFCLSSG
jgi:hypothetical protein